MLCGEASLVNHGHLKVRAITLRCRAWSCSYCQPWRTGRLIGLAKSGKPNTFITLTVNPKSGPNPEARARALVDAWRQVTRRAKRYYGYKTIPYLCVFEATGKGEPHLHILARCKWIDQKWLSAQMRQLINAPIVDIRRIRGSRHVAHYVAKYVGKGPGQFGTCKRYWHTRDYPVDRPEKPPLDTSWNSIWTIVDAPLCRLRLAWWLQGFESAGDARSGYAEYKKPP